MRSPEFASIDRASHVSPLTFHSGCVVSSRLRLDVVFHRQHEVLNLAQVERLRAGCRRRHAQNVFGQQYGIQGIPTMWLVDKKGVLVDLSARAGLAEKVEKLLAE